MNTIQCSDLLPKSKVNEMLSQVNAELGQLRKENSGLIITNNVLLTLLFLIIIGGSIYIIFFEVGNIVPAPDTQFNSLENKEQNDTGENKPAGNGGAA